MERTEVPRLVVDASVSAKWHLRDEDLVAEADVVLNDYREDRIGLIAPQQIRVEVAAAIRNATRNKRLQAHEAVPAIQEFLDLRIPMVPLTDDRLLRSTSLALRLNCSVYDALFLDLAEELECRVVYADKKLQQNLGTRFTRALWIEDYRLS